MDQKERTKQANLLLSCSALWYAWGQIDAGLYPTLNTEHGMEFQKLYELFIEDFASERAYYRPNVIETWKRFAAHKVAHGPNAPVTQNDVVDDHRKSVQA